MPNWSGFSLLAVRQLSLYSHKRNSAISDGRFLRFIPKFYCGHQIQKTLSNHSKTVAQKTSTSKTSSTKAAYKDVVSADNDEVTLQGFVCLSCNHLTLPQEATFEQVLCLIVAAAQVSAVLTIWC